jgi:hypothetical protein
VRSAGQQPARRHRWAEAERVYAAAVVWVLVFGGIALAGLVMLICYGVWLAHKAADVLSEIAVLADRADQLAMLLSQISPGPTAAMAGSWQSDLIVAEDFPERSAT